MTPLERLDLNDAHYVAVGESLRVIEEWQVSAQAFGEAVMALGNAHGTAVGYFTQNTFAGVRVTGWRFEGVPSPTAAWRPVEGRPDVWAPRGNTKLGRQVKALLNAIPQPVDILAALNLPGIGVFMVDDRWFTAGIAKFAGEWVITVPFGAHPDYAATAGVPLDARRITPEEARALVLAAQDGQVAA